MGVFVSVNDAGEFIGTVACNVVDQGDGHIRGMAVRPAWHGTGVATLLLARVESELRDRRCTRITLDATRPIRAPMRFYENYGFNKSGRVGDFFGMKLSSSMSRWAYVGPQLTMALWTDNRADIEARRRSRGLSQTSCLPRCRLES
jgi:ribosomal protein S18 acetylase RimI-like enzyme